MLDSVSTRRGRRRGQIPTPWTEEEEGRLKALVLDRVTIPGIAVEMNRTESSIRGRLNKLGIIALARRNRSDFHRGGPSFVTANLRFTHRFNDRLTNFCYDRDSSRSGFVELVLTAYMDQIESGASE